jgi:hypothetical protein
MVGVRMHEEMQDLIKNWAVEQNDHPSLGWGHTLLVELGLKAKTQGLIDEQSQGRGSRAFLLARAARAAKIAAFRGSFGGHNGQFISKRNGSVLS